MSSHHNNNPFIKSEREKLTTLLSEINVKRQNVDVLESGKRSPLIRASIIGDEKIIRRLLELKAQINLQDYLGKSALHYAAQEYYPAIVALLINHNANVNIADNHGNTPLHEAVFSSRGRGDIVLQLRRSGAQDNLPNKHGVTPKGLAKTIATSNVIQFFENSKH
jgi:ankyrin repeat protein